MTKAVTDYQGLVTAEHADKPNYMAVIAAIVSGSVANQAALAALPADFDLDSAVGAQLDVVGQWVGFSRQLGVPITGVYFSLDDALLGLDQGILYQPFDPTEGLISLDDATYRLMLYAKIAANIWDGSLAQAQKIFASIFVSSPGTYVFIQDNFDMTMYIGLSGVIPSMLFQKLLPLIQVRPAAVKSTSFVTTVSGSPIFGLDAETNYLAGLDVGALAQQIS